MKKEKYRVIIQKRRFQFDHLFKNTPVSNLLSIFSISRTNAMSIVLGNKFPHYHSNLNHLIYLYRCVLRTWRGPGCGWWCGWGLSWGAWPSSSRVPCLCTTCTRMTSSKPSTTPREKVSGTQREQLFGLNCMDRLWLAYIS